MRNSDILILGGGFAALRYVESLIWTEKHISLCGTGVLKKTIELSNRFGLPYMEFKDLTPSAINGFDCVIVTLPVSVKREYVGRILHDLQYRNALIVEKPLALDKDDILFYERTLTQLDQCAVVCQRDFFPAQYDIPVSQHYQILFPSYETDPGFNKTHMLPHVLSWLLAVDDSLTGLHLEDGLYSGVWRGAPLTLRFVDRRHCPSATINGREYPNVQYREVNHRIVDQVLSFSKEQTLTNVRRAVKVSEIITALS